MLALRAAVRGLRPAGPLAPVPHQHRRLAPLSTIPTTTPPAATNNHHQPPPPQAAVNFGDTSTAYSTLTTADLVRAYLVFRACGLRPLVAHADAVLRTTYKVLGKSVTEALVKSTFFKHFCAGETAQGIRPRVERLRKAGVGGILDYAAEADVQQMQEGSQAGTTQAYTEGAITCRCVLVGLESWVDYIHGLKAIDRNQPPIDTIHTACTTTRASGAATHTCRHSSSASTRSRT